MLAATTILAILSLVLLVVIEVGLIRVSRVAGTA